MIHFDAFYGTFPIFIWKLLSTAYDKLSTNHNQTGHIDRHGWEYYFGLRVRHGRNKAWTLLKFLFSSVPFLFSSLEFWY